MNVSSRNQKPIINNQQDLDGVVVIDKPQNRTSAAVVADVKRLLNAKKVGHAGTLDPFARGVLVCCVNNATRLARFLLQGTKKYEATLKLGIETDTQDSTGTVIAVNNAIDCSEKTIHAAFKQFEGNFEQLPPIYSALKHQGTPLYKLAREGKPVQKPPRQVCISYIQILDIQLPWIRFEVSCSAGTYIRTLCADIGKTLGCGAHLFALKRTESSGFTMRQAISLTALKELVCAGKFSDFIVSMSNALPAMPAYVANQPLIEKIRYGKKISKKDLITNHIVGKHNYFDFNIKVIDSNDTLLAVVSYRKNKDNLSYICVFTK
jgi:tRNA pseudouridine55 synthase